MTHSCERLRFVDTCPRCYDHECQKGRPEGRGGWEKDGGKRRERKRDRKSRAHEEETQKEGKLDEDGRMAKKERREGTENTDEHSSPMEFSLSFFSFFFFKNSSERCYFDFTTIFDATKQERELEESRKEQPEKENQKIIQGLNETKGKKE